MFRGREKGRERKIDVQEIRLSVASRIPPLGDLAHHPLRCPDWESNQWPFSLQAGMQSTEPHQPGLKCFWALPCTCLPCSPVLFTHVWFHFLPPFHASPIFQEHLRSFLLVFLLVWHAFFFAYLRYPPFKANHNFCHIFEVFPNYCGI